MKKTNKVDLKSKDIKEEQKKRLKQVFPEVFNEDKIDFEKLKLSLGEDVDIGRERYGMNWPGKAQAIKVAQLPSDATLKPDERASVDFDKTQNLFIEGDNLEVLKLLQKSYFGKIKMIYLDPPYNTGKEFIYPDKYEEGLQTYLQYTGQVDVEGKKFSTNVETDGRFHSKWMSMMWPRLYLSRNLLKNDGAIFISIDDYEVDNLRKICNEVFGEENFIGQFKWNRVAKAPSLSKTIRTKYEYVICFKKNDSINFFGKQSYNTQGPVWHNPNKQQELLFPAKSIIVPKTFEKGSKSEKYQIELLDDIIEEDGLNKFPVRIKACSAWGQEKINQYINNGNLFQIKKDIGTLYAFLPQGENNFIAPSDLISKEECDVDNNTSASADLEKLGIPFTNPKPVSLVEYLINMVTYTEPTATILDFFSGSATTAHAVMQLNAEDGGNRKFIMIQLPEITSEDSEAYKEGYKDIAKIGEERIRRAGKKILEENKEKEGFDTENFDKGFKVFKLDKSNFTVWDGSTDGDIQKKLELHVNNTDSKSGEEDILYEILIKAGFELSEKIGVVKIDNKKVYSVSDGQLLVCLDKTLDKDFVRSLAAKKPKQFICLNSSFKEDADLTNTAKILENNQIEFRTI